MELMLIMRADLGLLALREGGWCILAH